MEHKEIIPMLSWLRGSNPSTFLRTHWIALVFVVIGTLLRFYQLPERGILFGDSGHDLLLAATAVQQGNLPLLGIASSVPRFHQGPLTIWISMGIAAVAGFDPRWYFWVFAVIGCLALVAIYEFSLVWINQRTGLLALAFLAVSPLAVAHSRMVYHTVPIPFLTVLVLWSVSALLQRKANSWPWAVLAAAALFQHELSLFPVFLALPLAWWLGGIHRGKHWNTAWHIPLRQSVLSVGALGLGILPQLISEFRDGTQQVSGFILWLGYRVVSFLLPSSDHFAISTFDQVLERFGQYGSQVFLVPGAWNFGAGVLGGLCVLSALGWMYYRRPTTLSIGAQAVLIVTALITAGYLVHGAPSEAYFPVYVILAPLILAIGLEKLTGWLKYLGFFLTALVLLIAVAGIWQARFFVDQTVLWNYGPSVGAQRAVLNWITTQPNTTSKTLGSMDADAQFPNYLSSYVWLSQQQPQPIQTTTQPQQAQYLVTHQPQSRSIFTSMSQQLTIPTQLWLPAVRVTTR